MVQANPTVESVTIAGETSVLIGETIGLTATVSVTNGAAQTVTWSSSNTGVATVNPSTGEVTAIDTGMVNIIATSTVDSTQADTVTITVISVEGISISILEGFSDSVLKGDTTFLTVTISDTNAVQSVDWTSDSAEIATVTSAGEVVGVFAGVVNIIATSKVDSTQADTVTITVMSVNSVSIAGEDSVLKGSTLSLTATVSATHAPETVTWSSSDEAVATVDSTGVVTGVAVGTVTITVTSTVDATKTVTKAITVVDEGTSIVYLNKINLENTSVILYNTLGERIEGAALRNLQEGVYLVQQKGSKKFTKAVIR